MKDLEEELSYCRMELAFEEPFYCHILQGLQVREDPGIDTLGVGLRKGFVVLFINPVFLLDVLRERSVRVGVLKHELLHVIFSHLTRLDPQKHDPHIYGIAADLVVNQYVAPWPLPDGAVTLERFKDMGLAPNQTLEGYYEKLKHLQDLKGPGGTQPHEDAPPLGGWSSDHSGWGAEDPEDAVLREYAENEIRQLILQTKSIMQDEAWGSLPGSITSLVEALSTERPHKDLDWRTILRNFSRTNGTRTRLKGTFRRQSRRYPDQPGIKIARFQRLAVAVDTSGSISDSDLEMFFSEIHAMWSRSHATEITVLECDAALQDVYEYRGQRPRSVGGRGGTSFDPVFEYLRKHKNQTYDGCIYLTDGCAAEPNIKPPCSLLWVVTHNGQVGPHLAHGRVLQLPTP